MGGGVGAWEIMLLIMFFFYEISDKVYKEIKKYDAPSLFLGLNVIIKFRIF